jgi:hypothetical protein
MQNLPLFETTNNAVAASKHSRHKLRYAQNSMTHEDVAKLGLVESDIRDLTTGKIARYMVTGLPSHLKAEIRRGHWGCAFYLERNGRPISIYPPEHFPEPEGAFDALKRHLASN